MRLENTKSYGLNEKKIAQGLKQQPDLELLDKVETIEQFAAWVYQHLFYHCVSQTWQAIHGAATDPMRDELKAGVIDKHLYDQAWLTALFLQRLWELIQISFHCCIHPELKRLGADDSIQTPFDLFGWIICYESNNNFSCCLKPFYTFQARKQSQVYRAAVKALSEGAPLPKGDDEPNPGICLILRVCEAKATRNEPVLMASFKAFKTAAIDLYDYNAKQCWHMPSYRWNKGHYERGNKNGKYQPLTKLNNRTKILFGSRILL